MSIIGVGTDMVKKTRMEKVWREFGERFSKRILSDFEIKQLKNRNCMPTYLAKRFAAKEAVAKALGTGFSKRVRLTEIEIFNDDLGKPKVKFLGITKQFTESLGVKSTHLSITDEKEYAIALVVLEK